MNQKTIYWHLPGLCYYGALNHILFATMKQYPDMFIENYKIGSVYGTFPSAIWNGGRSILNGYSKKEEVDKIIQSYNRLGIPVRFTWTNVLLEEKHIHDEYCNMLMEVGNNGFNQVLVNSPSLEEYIRKTYPDYKVLSSTTKRILDIDKLMAEFEKDYYLVVLDYDLNHNPEVIERLLPVANRVELLVNEPCQPNCPQRENHYREISKCMLEHKISNKLKHICTDRSPDAGTFKGCMHRPAFISNENINDYADKGFTNFKIVGRGLTMDFYLDSLVYYFVKPEHRDFIRKYLADTVKRMSPQGRG